MRNACQYFFSNLNSVVLKEKSIALSLYSFTSDSIITSVRMHAFNKNSYINNLHGRAKCALRYIIHVYLEGYATFISAYIFYMHSYYTF